VIAWLLSNSLIAQLTWRQTTELQNRYLRCRSIEAPTSNSSATVITRYCGKCRMLSGWCLRTGISYDRWERNLNLQADIPQLAAAQWVNTSRRYVSCWAPSITLEVHPSWRSDLHWGDESDHLRGIAIEATMVQGFRLKIEAQIWSIYRGIQSSSDSGTGLVKGSLKIW